MSDKPIVIGIDPGKTGAIAIKNKLDGTFKVVPIPVLGKEVDLVSLSLFFKLLTIKCMNVKCAMEDVHAIYGSAAGSTFEFGYVNGVIEAMLVANDIPYTKVQPKKWQKEMWEGIPEQRKASKTGKTHPVDTKAMSLLAANRLFPGKDFRRTDRAKVQDNNFVDAALICEYCDRKL